MSKADKLRKVMYEKLALSGYVPTFLCDVINDGNNMTFDCPVCGSTNKHGNCDGHRGAHCECWERGYYITSTVCIDSDVTDINIYDELKKVAEYRIAELSA